MNMKEYVSWYEKQDAIVKLIFAIIPVTSWVNAILYRLGKGHMLSGILAIFFGFIFWIIDLVSVLLNGKPVWLLF